MRVQNAAGVRGCRTCSASSRILLHSGPRCARTETTTGPGPEARGGPRPLFSVLLGAYTPKLEVPKVYLQKFQDPLVVCKIGPSRCAGAPARAAPRPRSQHSTWLNWPMVPTSASLRGAGGCARCGTSPKLRLRMQECTEYW